MSREKEVRMKERDHLNKTQILLNHQHLQKEWKIEI
jgi:hypothetical protein